MVDEQQLVSLVLLLQLPPNSGGNIPVDNGVKSIGKNNDTGDGSTQSFNTTSTKQLDDSSSTLQAALEHNNFKLLCFIGRLIHQYKVSNDISGTSYAYLRLAIRILFLRYVSIIDTHNIPQDNKQMHQHDIDNRVQEYERYILKYTIDALNIRSKYDLCEADVEMAWVVHNLLGKLSKNNEGISQMWTDAIDTLVLRRKEGMCSSNKSIVNTVEPPQSDEEIMIKTIHSILDGDASSDDNQDKNDIMQYNISLLSCLQTYLQGYATDSKTSNMHQLTQQTLFNLIYWTQEKENTLSIDVYRLILQYLQTCIINVCGKDNEALNQKRNMNQFYSSCVAESNNKEPRSVEEFANALRSLLFYGLVVMGNTTTDTEQLSSTSTRGEVYSLILELWQLCGVDWLITSAAKTTKAKLWRFQEGKMKDSEHRLGSTWPLCTLVSLAAGEFRLALGRWVTIVESEQDYAKDYTCLVSEIHYTARIVTEAVHLMTELAEDEDALTTWTPDAILHIRKSLEDALNSSIQYFNTLFADVEVEQSTSPTPMSDAQRDVGETCCLVMGMIAAELEVDHLLAPPAIDKQNSLASKDDKEQSQNMSHALRGAVLFCRSLDGVQTKTHHEPLTHLLPCIISLVSTGEENKSSSGVEDALQFALDGLCKDNLFLNGISQLLDRTTKQFNESYPNQNNSNVQSVKSMMSTINLCLDIIAEFSIAGDNTSGRLVLPKSKETLDALSQLRSRAAEAMKVSSN